MRSDSNFAFSLYSVVDRGKVDASQGLPDALAEHLQAYLEGSLGIRCLSVRFLEISNEPYLLLGGVEEGSLAALCALVDVQGTQLFQYERVDDSTVNLTPVRPKVPED
jgi:hypothetical protein